MVEMGLLFLGFTLLVLLLFTVASIVYVPKVLSTEHDHEDDEDAGEQAA